MRLGRIIAAMMGMSAASSEYPRSGATDWDSILWHNPQPNKSKPNRVSQAKRRKYKRQGWG